MYSVPVVHEPPLYIVCTVVVLALAGGTEEYENSQQPPAWQVQVCSMGALPLSAFCPWHVRLEYTDWYSAPVVSAVSMVPAVALYGMQAPTLYVYCAVAAVLQVVSDDGKLSALM